MYDDTLSMGVTRYDINWEASDTDARKRDGETAEQTMQELGTCITFTVYNGGLLHSDGCCRSNRHQPRGYWPGKVARSPS